MHALDWQTLIFLLPILFGVLLVLGSSLGFLSLDADMDVDVDIDADVDVDVDADADADVDADGDAESSGPAPHLSVLHLLGVGRAPLSVLAIIGTLSFGALGLSAGFLDVPFAASLAIAVVGALLGTSLSARALARVVPTTESYAIEQSALVGCLGVVELRVDREFGLAHVTDRRGTLHKIRCRVDEAPLDKGAPVVVTDFDPTSGFYEVTSSPV